jgi:hypothetical protein
VFLEELEIYKDFTIIIMIDFFKVKKSETQKLNSFTKVLRVEKGVGNHYQSHSKGMNKELTKKESKSIDASLQEYLDLHQKESVKKSDFIFLMKRNRINEVRFEYIFSLLNSLKVLAYKNERGDETLGIKFNRNEVIELLKKGGITEKTSKLKSSKVYNEPWIGYLIAFIAILLAVYQGLQNGSLNKEITFLKLSVDSLRNEALSDKNKLDSLDIQYVLFDKKLFDLRNNIEKKK